VIAESRRYRAIGVRTGKGYPGGFRDAFDDAEVLGRYWRANVDPAERYVLSPSGSTKHRLAAGKSGFANLFLPGTGPRTA